MPGIKLLIAVVIAVVVMATNISAKKGVLDTCNYNIGGKACSDCCGRALAHCKLYCRNLGCNPYQKGVCNVNDKNKYYMHSYRAKDCPTKCGSKGRRTLESDEPSVTVNSRDFCDSCVKRVLQSCEEPECNRYAVIRQMCGNACL